MDRPSGRLHTLWGSWRARRLGGLALAVLLVGAAPAPAPPGGDRAGWAAVERLVTAGRPQAALERVEAIREAARAAGDEVEQARALVRETQLRTRLDGFETAVRALREEPWPEAPLPHLALQLVYAESLVSYFQVYTWEISLRERTVGTDEPDLRAWTREQVFAEADRTYREAWRRRGEWDELPVGALAGVLDLSSDYPARIRGTLQDEVAYRWADLLADSRLWSPAEDNEVYRLDRARLIDGGAQAHLPEPSEHPLVRLAALLADLEAWHLERGEPEAAVEARLTRLERLAPAFGAGDGRAALRAALVRRLDELGREWPWWSRGMATLASWTSLDHDPDARVRARELALEGIRAHPESLGAARCRYLVASIERPEFSVQAMTADGPGERSIQVTHRNLPRLWFRAYPLDLVSTVESARERNVLPAGPEVQEILKRSRPVAEWSVELPATPDYRSHRTYVTPPLAERGLYLIVASARGDFAPEGNQRVALTLVVTDLVLLTRTEADELHVTALSGSSGEPRPGARIDLYLADWQHSHRRVATATAGADGHAVFRLAPRNTAHFVLARDGEDVALDPGFVYPGVRPDREETTAALVYTDRSVYRPGQPLLWKVVLYRGVTEDGRFRTLPETDVLVRLYDPTSEVAAETRVSTNGFGTASGRFEIPTGRLLGAWTVSTTPGGAAGVRVEEYKRPTFEVTLEEPEEALRLGRPARLAGEARYYFGQPVSGGKVSWRVTRQPVYPGWWWYLRSATPAPRAQIVAGGTAELDASGHFEVAFTPEADEQDAGDGAAGGVTYRYRLDADVTAEGGETRSATRSFRLGFVAVEARVDDDLGFHRAGEPVVLTIRRTDLDGAPRAGAGRWRLVRLAAPERTLLPAELPEPPAPDAEEGYRTPGDRLRPRWDRRYDPRAALASWPAGEEVAAGSLEHGEDGRAEVAAGPLPPGAYRLLYETEDRFGARFETRHEVLVAPAPGARASLDLPIPALLLVERDVVDPGGTIRLLVHSGLPDQTLWLEIWRQGAEVEHRRLTSGDGPHVLELPVGPEPRGGLVVSLAVLRDHQLIELAERVRVPWRDRELSVELATFRDRLRPGSREEWRVTVRGADGEALAEGAAEVLAAMYDRGLDLFAPHRPPSPLGLYPTFPYVQPPRASLGVRGAVWQERRGWDHLPPYPTLGSGGIDLREGPGVRGRGGSRFAVDGVTFGFEAGAALELERIPRARDPWKIVTQTPGVVSDRINVGGNESGRYYAFDQREEMKVLRVTGESPIVAEPAPAPPPPITLRTDFAETAFFEPHLLTGADGSVSFAFTVPDSVTEWNVWVQAVTRDLRAGSTEARTRTVKELLVRPYLPRFLREGDRAEIRVVVDDSGPEPLSGTLQLDLFDPETGESRLADFGLTPADAHDLPFEVAAGGGATLTFPLTVPTGVGSVAFRVTARAGEWSDGEQRPVPVLPGRVHLAQSRFAVLHDADRATLRFPDLAAAAADPTLENDQLVVTLDAQLFDAVLRALPYLVDYPYECTEQTLNRFLSTAVVSSIFEQYPGVAVRARELAARDTRLEPWDEDDPNRKMALVETPWLVESRGGRARDDLIPILDPEVAAAQREAALLRLGRSQTSLGGFPWFPGGPPSPYMTLYLLQGFSRALDAGVSVPREMVVAAWAYMHRHAVDEILRSPERARCCGPTATFLAYVLSSYPDPERSDWTGGVFSAEDRRRLLDLAFRHWRELSHLQKAQLALALHRAGREDDARLVFESLMDAARTDELGTSWAPEERSWLWYQDTVETHAFALRAINELAPNDPRRHGVVRWLLLDRKLGHWKSTRATAEVISALVEYLEQEGEIGVREAATVTAGPVAREFVFEPDEPPAGATRLVIPGPGVTPEMAEVTVEKSTPGFLFATATWHFSTEEAPARGDGDLLAVERTFYRRVPGVPEWTLEPLANGARIEVGDEVEVQLSIRARHAAEYVHLRDPRGAGFEPETLTSGYRWDLGVIRYEEVRDSGTDLFFERLPAGEYTFRHRLRATTAGTFHVAPATLRSMYAPEFTAYSAGEVLRVAAESD